MFNLLSDNFLTNKNDDDDGGGGGGGKKDYSYTASKEKYDDYKLLENESEQKIRTAEQLEEDGDGNRRQMSGRWPTCMFHWEWQDITQSQANKCVNLIDLRNWNFNATLIYVHENSWQWLMLRSQDYMKTPRYFVEMQAATTEMIRYLKFEELTNCNVTLKLM